MINWVTTFFLFWRHRQNHYVFHVFLCGILVEGQARLIGLLTFGKTTTASLFLSFSFRAKSGIQQSFTLLRMRCYSSIIYHILCSIGYNNQFLVACRKYYGAGKRNYIVVGSKVIEAVVISRLGICIAWKCITLTWYGILEHPVKL